MNLFVPNMGFFNRHAPLLIPDVRKPYQLLRNRNLIFKADFCSACNENAAMLTLTIMTVQRCDWTNCHCERGKAMHILDTNDWGWFCKNMLSDRRDKEWTLWINLHRLMSFSISGVYKIPAILIVWIISLLRKGLLMKPEINPSCRAFFTVKSSL